MSGYNPLDDALNHGVLLEIGKRAAANAADALSAMIDIPVTIDITDVNVMSPDKVQGTYHKSDQVTIGLFMDLPEEFVDFILALEREEGLEFARSMLIVDSLEGMEEELVADALKELANVVLGSFITVLSDAMGIRMIPTPPQLMIDYFDSLLGQFLIKQELTTDLSIVFEATFKKNGQVIDANLIALGGHQILGKIAGT